MTDNENHKGDLFSITTIQEAAAVLRKFKTVTIDIGGETGNVEVIKLPAAEFAEGLARFSGTLAPMVESARKEGEIKLDAAFIEQLGKHAPETLLWLAFHGTDLTEEKVGKLPWDAVALLALAVLLVNFMDNATLRVFTPGVGVVSKSVAAESAAVASDAPPTTDRS